MDDEGNHIAIDDYIAGAIIGSIRTMQYEELNPTYRLIPKYIYGYQQLLAKVMDIANIGTEGGQIYMEVSVKLPGL